MTVIRRADARRTTTHNGTMTTLASPAQGGAAWAVWHVEMPPRAAGPRHAFDTEQVWTFLTGSAVVDLDGVPAEAGAGDTAVLPADVPRRVTAGPGGFTAVVTAPAGTRVYDATETRDDCDIAPKPGERLVPPWAV
ncbi:cupin domain-containing protein [Actinomadura flavalba]|uniref:cupin domain-containing protein n=1 Tax=Actinomadura flavalba TaxID=1120938 RepID=UPI000370F081|nr:cupin domain-containing protein [Actinomadura flavalba]